MNRFIRNSGFYLILFLVVVGVVQFLTNGNDAADLPKYNQLRQQVVAKNVKEVTAQFDGYAYLVTGKYVQKPEDVKSESFSVYIPATDAALEELVEASESNGFDLEILPMEGQSIWLTLLSSFIPLILMFVLFFFLFNQSQGGGGKVMNFGKSRARLYNEEKKRVTFEDVAGADEEKQELSLIHI